MQMLPEDAWWPMRLGAPDGLIRGDDEVHPEVMDGLREGLVHYLKRDRISAVVRRSADRLDGQSMVDLVGQGRTTELLEFTRAMFDLHRLDAA